jgi:predicted PurR-regulated permease PerM
MACRGVPALRILESRVFLGITVFVTVALGWILWPYFGAILWGTVLVMLFAPFNAKLQTSMGLGPTWSALLTMAVMLVAVILPLLAVAAALVRELTALYEVMSSGDVDFGKSFTTVADRLPKWMRRFLELLGVSNLGAVQQKLTFFFKQGSQALALQIVAIGQSAAHLVLSFFVMMYLLFFLLRDGDRLFVRIKSSISLPSNLQDALFEKFVTVVRATVKGDMLVALLQGTLGGLAFWTLGIRAALVWAVVMAVVSLLPAIGAAIVWLPVSIFLLASGSVWQGLALIAFGTLVIGLVDNILRPILVGQDTKMPGYLVLLSTLGGLEAFGLNGFVLGPVIAAMFLAVWEVSTKASMKPL